MRFSSLFLSRWLALVWSAGIVWTATDVAKFVSPANSDGSDARAGNGAGDLNELQDLVERLESR